jgi:hypothetical protein
MVGENAVTVAKLSKTASYGSWTIDDAFAIEFHRLEGRKLLTKGKSRTMQCPKRKKKREAVARLISII